MNKLTNLKGFTLVELIVVIAIIGVLAAILVPSMAGYVTKAKFSSANSVAKTLYNAAMAACVEDSATPSITSNTYSNISGSSVTCDDALNKRIYAYARDLQHGVWAVKIKDNTPVSACYRESTTDPYLGTYPNANNKKYHFSTPDKGIDFGESGTGNETWA